MAIFVGSRYVNTPAYYKDNAAIILNIRVRHDFDLNRASTYIWHQNDTIDSVSFAVYNTTRFWWAIMDANRQYLSELDIKPGDIIVIPAYDEVVRISG